MSRVERETGSDKKSHLGRLGKSVLSTTLHKPSTKQSRLELKISLKGISSFKIKRKNDITKNNRDLRNADCLLLAINVSTQWLWFSW